MVKERLVYYINIGDWILRTLSECFYGEAEVKTKHHTTKLGPMLLFFIFFFPLLLSNCNINPALTNEMTEQVASCLGTDPSWEMIRGYFLNDAFNSEMTRDEVHQVLDCFGPWSIELLDDKNHGGLDSNTNKMVFRENIRFDRDDIDKVMKKWGFYYDAEDKFVDVSLIES